MKTIYCSAATVAVHCFFAIIFATTMSVCGEGLDFSLRSGSPKVPNPFSAADDIEALGASVRIPAASLGGSAASSDVNGLSYGQSEAADVTSSPYFYKRLAYSVKHGATGNGGAPVTTEVQTDGAAGDTFALDFAGVGTKRYVLRSPFTLVKAQTRNLTVQSSPPSDPEDDIDALALHRDRQFPVYVTFAPGGSYDPAAIYIINAPGGPPQVFASAAQLGLVAGDVIDGFSLGTIPFGGSPPTMLDSHVVIWLTLAIGSPSRGTADSIMQAWPGPLTNVLSAAQLNLASGDEIDAIAVLDPLLPLIASSIIGLPGFNLGVLFRNNAGKGAITTSAYGNWNYLGFDDQGWTSSAVFVLGPGLDGHAIFGDPIVAVGVDAYNGAWQNPDGGMVGSYGSFLAFFNSGPPFTHCGDPIKLSTNPTVGFRKLQLTEDTLYAMMTLPAAIVTMGGTTLNPGSTANTLFLGEAPYSCTADMANIGPPTGLRVEAWDTNGTTQISFNTSPGADLQMFGNQVVGAIALRSSGFGSTIPKFSVNPVGAAGTSNVVNNPGNAPIVVFSQNAGDPLPQVTVIPVSGYLYYPPFVDCIEFLSADVMLVSVEANQTFDMLGQTFGKSGYSTLNLIKIDLSGAMPTAQLIFSSDAIPSGATCETTSMAVNPLNPDEVLWIGNSYFPGTSFTLPVRSPDGSAAFNINHSGGSAEGYGVVFNPFTGSVGTIFKAFPGPAADDNMRAAKFSQCCAYGPGYSIVGLCGVSNSIIIPGNLEIPVFTGDPPQEVFFATVGLAGATLPSVSSSMTPDGHIHIEFSGTLETSTTLMPGSWTDVQGAVSPYDYVPDPMDPVRFWRAHN